MKDNKIAEYNAMFRNKPALDIVRWGIVRANGHAVVSTSFCPSEAVILHLCIQVQPDIPVLWVDHGYNRPATYRYVEKLCERLNLNLKTYLPKLTAAHRDAIHGPIPNGNDEAELKMFSTMMKLEPFQRGMKELAPAVWITALRKVQNPECAKLDLLAVDNIYNTLRINPVLYWKDADMEAYLIQHNLSNEWDYIDPANLTKNANVEYT